MQVVLITSKSKEPVAPYNKVMPNSKKPVENAPIKKYFKEASLDAALFFFIPAKMYKLTDMISIPINNMVKF